jgi:hypothetical protein
MLLKAGEMIDKMEPYLNIVQDKSAMAYQVIEPYHPVELIPIFWGFIMIFFGGFFFTLIAAIEAYRIFAWEKTKGSFGVLFTNYRKASKASMMDDKLDEDGDGIADVKQITNKQLLTRKLLLTMRSVNPVEVTEAVSAISRGVFAVIGSLRSKFLGSITLGASIGDITNEMISPYLVPALQSLWPDDYEKWIPIVLRYVCASMGMSFAWFIQRIISAFHSSFRGSFLLVSALLAYLTKYGYISPLTKTQKKTYVLFGMGLGVMGFGWQFMSGFTLPFPLNILLLPLTITESVLMHVVATSAA